MLWLYLVAIATHALVAVLGIGQVLGLAFLAGEARSNGSDRLPVTLGLMRRLARVTSISLGLMLLSGIGVMIPTRGAYGAAWWFRIAFVLFLVLGFFNGQLQRALRVASGPASDASARAVARLSTLTWTMCGIVTVIVILMASKPF
jgi:hypothetical protein